MKKTISILMILCISVASYASFRSARKDLDIDKGGDWNPIIAWETASQNRVDLTGYSAQLQIRRRRSSSPSFNLSTTNNLIGIQEDAMATAAVASTVTGTISISLSANATATFDWENGLYSMLLTDTNGNKIMFMHGNLRILDTGFNN